MNVAELARIARQDLTTILDLARWAHADAYQRNAPNPDAKRSYIGSGDSTADVAPATAPCPICHGRPPTVDGATCTGCDGHGTIPVEPAQHVADLVRADTYDLAVGSHPSRRAWQVSIGHLAHAERYAATALHLATGERPRLIKPGPAAPLPDVERTIQTTRARLGRIDRGQPAAGVHPALVIVVAHTEKAWGALNLAFTRGKADPATQAVGEPMCIICGIRPRAEKSGKRCNTCYSWWRRNRKERPTTLDGGGKEPLRAQQRRLERGDGWGDESASCTQPLRPPDPPIVKAPHQPTRQLHERRTIARHRLLAHIQTAPSTFDMLRTALGWTTDELAPVLSDLERFGWVERRPGPRAAWRISPAGELAIERQVLAHLDR